MFTPAKRLQHIQKSATRVLFDSAPPGSINLGLGEPDFRTPELIRREAIKVVEDGRIGYTTNAGIPQLRELIAAYHNEDRSPRYKSESVCVMAGAEEALFAVMMTILDPGDQALMPNPCYIAYPAIARIAGAEERFYSMPSNNGFAFDRDRFSQSVTDRTKVVVINSPSNPTSRVISRGDLRFIADRLSETNSYVIADEIYRDLYSGERPSTISEFYERTIIVSGLSKMLSMTGWRMGWAVGPEDVIRPVTVMRQYMSSCTSTVTQKAALVAFTNEARQETNSMRAELNRRGEVMASAIDREVGLPYCRGEGAYYIMLDVSRFGLSMDTAMSLLKHRVITVPGSAFGDEAEGFLRLSFSVEEQLIEEGIRRIAQGLKEL